MQLSDPDRQDHASILHTVIIFKICMCMHVHVHIIYIQYMYNYVYIYRQIESYMNHMV